MTTHRRSKLEKALQQQGITETEVLTLIKSARGKPQMKKCIKYPSNEILFGYMSDTHGGHKEFKEDLYMRAAGTFNNEKVDLVLHPGDHVEGMSGRPGHIYELSHIGFHAQVNYMADLYKQINAPIYGIDGNHDNWYQQKNNNGAYVGRTLQTLVKNFTHLGEWEGRLKIGAGLEVLLIHPNDGTAYADSYKLQKRIESLSEDEKPQILLEGHYHKSIEMYRRGVYGFECATLCGQTGFMKGRGIPAHVGYGLIKVKYNKFGILDLKHQFFPNY